VLLTRERDVALELRQRPRLANDWKGDALVSIHANAHEAGEASGMEVFFLAADASAEASRDLVEREEGIRPADATAGLAWSVGGILADLELAAQHRRSEWLALALGDALKIARPQARFRGVRQAPFGVLKEARMAAVVLEVGYITHPVEGPQLTEPAVQDQFSRAILKALWSLEQRMAAEAKVEKAAAAKANRAPRKG
jgi:N-acetylmuramoyl-L-alanine amidase